MAEVPSHSFGEVLSRFIKLLSADPKYAGLSPDEIQAEAVKKAQATQVERQKAANAMRHLARENKRKREAREWVDKVRSEKIDEFESSQQQVEKGKYTDGMTVDSVKKDLRLREVAHNSTTPDWLNVGNIEHSPEVVEFIGRISELPQNLRDDPQVLYYELGKLDASIRWHEISVEARNEARKVIEKVVAHISDKGVFERESGHMLLEHLGLDHYHLEHPEPSNSAGEPPKKKGEKGPDKISPDYQRWGVARIAQAQAEHLQNMVETYQQILDLPQNSVLENQKKQLMRFISDLRDGSNRGQRIKDIDGTPPQLNRDQAIKYIEAAQARVNKLEMKYNFERDLQYQKKSGERTITIGELRQKDWYLADVLSKSAQELPNEDTFTFGRNWTKDDVRYLMEHGYRRWFYRYIDQVFGLGTERKQPSLSEQYMFEDFRGFLKTVYQKDAQVMLEEFQSLWDERGRLDYIVHSVGLGAGDMKRRLEAMSMFTSGDVDKLNKNFPHANLAYSFMERETFGVMENKLSASDEQIAFLRENIGAGYDPKLLPKDVQGKLLAECQRLADDQKIPEKSRNQFKKIKKIEDLTSLSRADLLHVLKKEKFLVSPEDFAKSGHQSLQERISFASDKAARGVILEDVDVWGYSDIDVHLEQVTEKIAELERRHRSGSLTAEELKTFESDVNELKITQKGLAAKLLAAASEQHLSLDDKQQLIRQLAERRGLSTIELRAFERMKEYLKAKTGREQDDVELRTAMWAARTQMIATGRMAAIGAMMARMPGSGELGTASGKHVMRAPAFEDLVRAMNVEMFASRFGMGGKMGDVVRAYLRFNLRASRTPGERGSKIKPPGFFQSSEWNELKGNVQDAPSQAAVQIMEFAERDLGINLTELLTPGFMATGGQYDGTSWRLDLGVIDKIKDHYLKLQEEGKLDKAILDNQALAIRYLVAGSEEERRHWVERMMRRTPTKFLQFVTNKHATFMKDAGLDVTDATWIRFENALKYAETDLWKTPELAIKDIDLGSDDGFKLVASYLENGGVPKGDLKKYQEMIKMMRKHLSDEVKGAEYTTILDGLAKEKLPLTLSLDDFDFSRAEMKDLGELAFPRRTRDIGGMDAAKDIIIAFITNKDNILSPNDPSDVFKQLLALKGAVNSYSPTETAETVVKEISRLVIEFNRDRSLWSAPSFLPGGKKLGLLLSQMDLREKAPYRGPIANLAVKAVGTVGPYTIGLLSKATSKIGFLHNFIDKRIFPGWKGFTKPVAEWPHSIGEAISRSVRFTGAHGNHWDEQKIDEFITTMEDMGLFTEKPEFVHDLRGEFKAGFTMKGLAVVRRFWWVVIVATIAVAALEATEEEKKKSSR